MNSKWYLGIIISNSGLMKIEGFGMYGGNNTDVVNKFKGNAPYYQIDCK